MKSLAREALLLLRPTSARDAFLSAVDREQPTARPVIAHVTRVLSTSADDEEWSQLTRFVELGYAAGVLTFAAYDNFASMVGASQRYAYQVRSDRSLDAEDETNLKRWMEEWRELLANCLPGFGSSIYEPEWRSG